MASDASPETLPPVLPPELLEPILLLACDLHGPAVSQALALVSKSVCILTAPARFRTVVLTSEAGFLQFWSLLAEQQAQRLICDEWGLPGSYVSALTTNTATWLQLLGRTGGRDGVKIEEGARLAELQRRLETECVPRPPNGWKGQGEGPLEELYPPAPAEETNEQDASTVERSISYPTGKPLSHYIESLLIDLQPPTNSVTKPPDQWPTAADARRSTLPSALGEIDLDDADEASNYESSTSTASAIRPPRGDAIALMDEIDAVRSFVAQTLATELRWKHGAPEGFCQKLRELPDRHGNRACHLLEHMPRLERLSLGGTECQAFRGSFSCASLHPQEVTLVYNGDEELLQDFVKSCVEVFSIGQPGALPTFALTGIRQRLRKLHVIGIDPRSPLTGISMPIAHLDTLRAGSIRPDSYISHACTYWREAQESGRPLATMQVPANDFCTGVQRLRYDTRKFGFRPVEILASRLRLLIQELQVKAFQPDDQSNSTASAEDKTQHFLAQVDARIKRESRLYELMAHWGVGGFQKLQLAWQSSADAERVRSMSAARKARYSDGPPAPATFGQSEVQRRREAGMTVRSRLQEVEEQIKAKAAVQKSTTMNGGWPQEMKDVWTERSDRDLNPTFGHELVDAIRQLFGWTSPPQSESTFLASIREGIDPATTQSLAAVGGILEEVFLSRAGEEPAPPNPDAPTGLDLCFGIRMPATFMRFEGEAAFEKQERIALFLDASCGGAGAWD